MIWEVVVDRWRQRHPNERFFSHSQLGFSLAMRYASTNKTAKELHDDYVVLFTTYKLTR